MSLYVSISLLLTQMSTSDTNNTTMELQSLVAEIDSIDDDMYRVEKQYNLLQFMKKYKIERPDLICEHGKAIIDYCSSHSPSRLATFVSSFISLPLATVHNNLWNIYEAVCLAAMDAHLPEMRNWCLQQLEAEFPRSLRALRLRGQVYESAEQWNDALAMYKQVLAKDPADLFVWRRHIAVLRASQHLTEAVEALEKLCARFPEDTESVEELYLIYTHAGDHVSAQHAAESLLLTRPEDGRYSVLVADSMYAQGMYKEARHYYAQALELRPEDRRAAMGILACLRATGETEPHLPVLSKIALAVLCKKDSDAGASTSDSVASAFIAMTKAAVNENKLE